MADLTLDGLVILVTAYRPVDPVPGFVQRIPWVRVRELVREGLVRTRGGWIEPTDLGREVVEAIAKEWKGP